MKKVLSAVVAALFALMVIGCANWSVGPKQSNQQPTLPSEQSMSLPDFGSGSGGGLSKMTATPSAYFTLSVLAVTTYTSAVKLALVEPTLLFVLVHQYGVATALDDNSGWKWVVRDSAKNYSAVLVGRVDGDSARWSMTVSGPNFTNFKWYDGTSTITGKVGYWTFYDTANGYPAASRFSYNITALDVGTVRVDMLNGQYAGNWLKWTSNLTQKSMEGYDATKTPAENIIISWDAVTEAGSIQNKTPGNEGTACWDTKANDHADIPCN